MISKVNHFILTGCMVMGLFMSGITNAQQLEISAGAAYKSFLGAGKNFYQPATGVEFTALKQDYIPYSSDVMNLGVNIGIFRFDGKQGADLSSFLEEGQTFQKQIIETRMVYRYDYYYNDLFSFFVGSDLGFQFVSMDADSSFANTESPSTKIFTTLMLAPNGGVNYEFNEYLAAYYKLEYGLSVFLGEQPAWGTPSSKWNHMLTNSAGVRLRFY